MAKFIESPKPSESYVELHPLTVQRIAEWLGYSADAEVPLDIAGVLPRTGPRARVRYWANAFVARDYLEKFPQHRFPEREVIATLKSLHQDAFAQAIVALGSPDSFYWPELGVAVSADAYLWMTSPAGRNSATNVLWVLGYEKWPNLKEQQGRWLFKGRQTSRYRKRPVV